MLVLTRSLNEKVIITCKCHEEITLTNAGVKGNQVRFGINADNGVTIHREEIQMRIDKGNAA